MRRQAALGAMSAILFAGAVAPLLLPGPPRFARAAEESEAEAPDFGEHRYATLLRGWPVGDEFVPRVERARVVVSLSRLAPGIRVVGYRRGDFDESCGLLFLDDAGRPILHRVRFHACTTRFAPVLASAGDGAGWAAWERGYREIVISRVTATGEVREVGALERPATPFGVLTPLVSFETEPRGRARLRYGDRVVEVSPEGVWPDGASSRARVASTEELRAAFFLTLAAAALFAFLALREQGRLRAARRGPMTVGLVHDDDRARPVLVAADGTGHALDLRGAAIHGDALAPDWQVLGDGVSAGEGAYRERHELSVVRAYAGTTPEAFHSARRDLHWLRANLASVAAVVMMLVAAFA